MKEIAWFAHSNYPLLAMIQILPMIGTGLIFLFRNWTRVILLALLIAGMELFLAILIYLRIDKTVRVPQFAEHVPLIQYHVAADGITVLFVLLAAFIILMLTIYSLVRRLHSVGRLFTLILAAETTIMVMLTTFNLLWFSVASAVELVLVALFLGDWSTAVEENRARAMLRFLQFQGVGLMLLCTGTTMLAWNYADFAGHWSFDLFDLIDAPLSAKFQPVIFFLLFYGFALRTPLFPLHGWLPHVLHRGTVAVAPAILLGVKTGVYGMVRFLLPLVPAAALTWRPYVVGIAMTGVFYAATLALLQTNLRRLLSFAVISHTSLIIVGLFTLNKNGIQGAMLLSITAGLAVTVMLFMVGFVFRRSRSTDLDHLGGLFDRIPFVAIIFFVAGLSTIGMPGTPSFDAAHLVLSAVIERFGTLSAVTTALGNVAAAGFLLWAFQRAFLSPPLEGHTLSVEKTLPMEYLIGTTIIAVLLMAGFYVEPWLDLIEAPIQVLVNHLGEAKTP